MKNYIKRAIRTFVQTAVGYLVVAVPAVDWADTGTGAELAANIMTNSQDASMFVDLATFTPFTGTNVVNIYNKIPPELTDGTYYLYWETSTDNFCPSIHQLYI